MLARPDVGRLNGPDDVHVWTFTTEQVALDEFAALLSADEMERAQRYRFPRDRRHFVVRRGQLRRLLGAYVDRDPGQVRFVLTPHGKPLLAASASDLRFSVAHSAGVALVAVGRGSEIGVDVEQVRPAVTPSLIARVCTPYERGALARLPKATRVEGFYTLWTHKEALIKADGRGLSLPVGDIDVSEALSGTTALTTLAPRQYHAAYISQSIPVGFAFAGAVARHASTIALTIRELVTP